MLAEHGASLQSQAPFTGEPATCLSTPALFHLEFPGTAPVSDFKSALRKQPLLVSMRASPYAFFQYSKGIIPGESCGDIANHAMLAVGYGVNHGVEFAILQNQWGEDWGESGYTRVQIEESDRCGIVASALAILV